jgi:hypothetical protein
MPRIFRNYSRESAEQGKLALLKIAHLRFRAFSAKFGRDPRIDEPLFFDESQDAPVLAQSSEVHEQLARGAREAGVELEPVLSFLAQPNDHVHIARRSARGLSSRKAGRYNSRSGPYNRAEGNSVPEWTRFLTNERLHRRHRITPDELRTLSKTSFLGETCRESDFLLMLRIIRSREQD